MINCSFGQTVDPTLVSLDCLFYTNSFGEYFCEVQNLEVLDEKTAIIQVRGQHEPGKSNPDVQVLTFEGKNKNNMLYLPTNFVVFFYNMEKLVIWDVNLNYVRRQDFYGLWNLRKVTIIYNHINEIPGDLFANFNKLENLQMNNNEIKKIGRGFFNFLPMLKEANLKDNICIDKSIPYDASLAEMNTEIQQQCSRGSIVQRQMQRNLGLSMECKFYEHDEDYVCEARGMKISQQNTKITQITGSHMNNKSNSDVTSFMIKKQQTKYLPSGFMTFFPNLRVFVVKSSHLKYLTRQDLSGAFNLREIIFSHNEIEELNGDTFTGFTLLEKLDMHGNKLKTIGANIFDSIGGLKSANFLSNRCINKSYPRDMGFQEMKLEIRQKCAGGMNSIRKINNNSDYSLSSSSY